MLLWKRSTRCAYCGKHIRFWQNRIGVNIVKHKRCFNEMVRMARTAAEKEVAEVRKKFRIKE